MKEKLQKKMVLPVALASALALAGCSASEINSGIGVAGNLFKGFSITNEQLAAEARLSVEAMDKKQKVASAKNRYSRRLRKLTRNLQHYEGMNLNYKVYLSKTVNAFATPDGSVRVYSGLMDMMSDDELLAVIGHEIGHVKKQHSLNEYKKAYIAKAVKEGVTAYGSGTASALAGSYGDIGLQFLGAQFSQSDELEADSYGVGVLKYLGKNPCAAVSAQRKLQQLGSSGGLFSSHPSSAKRIDKLDKVTGGVCAK